MLKIHHGPVRYLEHILDDFAWIGLLPNLFCISNYEQAERARNKIILLFMVKVMIRHHNRPWVYLDI